MAGEGLGIEARDLLGKKLAEGVVVKGGGTGGIGGGGWAAHRVVGVGDVGSGVGVVDGEELAPVVVSISGGDAAGVGAGGEAAIVGVGVSEALAIGVGLGEEDTGGVVVRPCGGVAHAGGLVAVGGHGGLVAEDIVDIAHRIGGAPLIGSVAPQIVFIDRDVAEGIGDGDGLPHHVIAVGRDGSYGIGGGDEIALGIVGINGTVVAAIDGSHAAIERIVLKAVGHACGIH